MEKLCAVWIAILAAVVLGVVDCGALSLPQENENDLEVSDEFRRNFIPN